MRTNNSIVLKGNLGGDPEVITKNDKKFTVLNMAVSNDVYDKDTKQWFKKEPTWVSVYVYGPKGEKATALKQGNLIRAHGRITSYVKEINKQKFKMYGFVAESIEKIDTKSVSDFPDIPNFDDSEEVPF